jgi:large repetitive protein
MTRTIARSIALAALAACAAWAQLTITTTSPLATATVGAVYSQNLAACCGVMPYQWAVTAGTGSLPNGLSLSTGGAITGTPLSTAVTSTFTVQVTDSTLPTALTASMSFTLPVTLAVSTTTLPSAAVNATYPSTTLQAVGGTPPYSNWVVSKEPLPAGMALNSATGVISGAPSTATGSPVSFSVTVQDAALNTSLPQSLSLTINPALAVKTTSPLPQGTVQVSYSQTLAASGGAGGYNNWTVVQGSGALPGGLTLNSSSGAITGTPTTTTGSPFSFSVTVQDSAGNTSPAQPLSLTVNPALVITTNSPLPQGTMGVNYSQSIVVTGGSGSYTWAVSVGTLPNGLSLNSATGLISGQPSTAATSNFTIQVTDTNSVTATKPFALTINPALAITTASPLPQGTVQVNYSQSIAVTGGSGSYTWAVSVGTLPNGLSLNSATGLISGQPSTAATSSFTIQVTDTNNATAAKQFMLTINPALVIKTTSPLPAGTLNVNYSETLVASGGSGTYTWAVSAGSSLPGGLSLNSGTGVISGLPGTAATSNFTIQVTDTNQVSVASPFSLTIDPTLTITTSSPLGNGAVKSSYNSTLTGSGGLPPYSWSLAAGSAQLPPGLTLTSSSTTGTISGLPSTAGTYLFKIQLTDSTTPTANTVVKQFSITIGGGLTITNAATLPNATVGVAYSQTLAAAGGVPPYVSWVITKGSLPAPLLLNSSSGLISGTPTSTASAAFTVTVTDSASNNASQAFTLTVVTPPAINTTSLPNGTAGVAYSQALSASGGTMPYQWAISSGSLPGGLSLSTTGTIAGMPSAAGTSSFTVQLTDATLVTASRQFTLVIVAPLAISTTSPLPTGEATIAYSQRLAAIGGTSPYTWSVIGGTLPPGLTLSTSGSLSGTPSTAGGFTFKVQATDSNNLTATAQLSVTIAGAVGISTPAALNGGSLNSSYSQSLMASNGVGPYSWSLTTGLLPPGLNLSPAGAITGVPAATGTFQFTAKVTDSLGATASRQFTIIIAIGLSISTPPTLPVATVGVPYSDLLQASGGSLPYTWTVSSGSPPAGLSLKSSGSFTGTPTTAGTFSFTVQALDNVGHQASEQLSITVAAALGITTSALPGGTVGAAYSQSLAATGGTPPFTWSLLTGALPGGLAISAAGSITGAPNAAGTFSFTIEVTDSAAASATKQLSITVAGGLSITTAAALPNASLNASYSQTLSAGGGAPPYTWALTGGALPTGLKLSAAGAITGAATKSGTFQFTATVTDSASGTASQQFTLIVGGLSITPTTLPGGKAGAPYSQTLTATGGTPPYTFTTSAGSLPPGITLTGAVLGGTPTQTGSYTFTIQVTDSTSATATQQFTIAITGLAICTSALPSAAVGTAYSLTLCAAGTAPYTWAIQGLPNDLSFDASTGKISGTPTAASNSNVTIQVTDSTKATASATFPLAVISASFSGLSSTADAAQQLSGTLALGAAYPQAMITGQITLSFQPDASLASPADDPAVQFSTGGVTASFTIPANSTAPVPFSLQTGTVAGNITLTVSWQAGGAALPVPAALTQAIQIAPAVPVISAVTATSTSSGFEVVVTGYSNTREVSQAVLQFTPASGQTLQTTSLTVSLTSAAATWFQGSTSDQYGGQFILTLPFTVTDGSASAIGSISVQLVNDQGTSTAASATL